MADPKRVKQIVAVALKVLNVVSAAVPANNVLRTVIAGAALFASFLYPGVIDDSVRSYVMGSFGGQP